MVAELESRDIRKRQLALQSLCAGRWRGCRGIEKFCFQRRKGISRWKMETREIGVWGIHRIVGLINWKGHESFLHFGPDLNISFWTTLPSGPSILQNRNLSNIISEKFNVYPSNFPNYITFLIKTYFKFVTFYFSLY